MVDLEALGERSITLDCDVDSSRWGIAQHRLLARVALCDAIHGLVKMAP